MSRAFHKMRSDFRPIAFVVQNNGNTIRSSASSITFTNKPVGSGAGRTIIIMATTEDGTNNNAEITTCTVDGNSCTLRVEHGKSGGSFNDHTAIFTRRLTTENGDVDIVIGSNLSPDSWGLSYVVVSGMKSEVPTDSAVGDRTFSPVVTSTTLEGLSGGIAVGVTAVAAFGSTMGWGSSMTEHSDVGSGGIDIDHRHSNGYDLLPTGRSASTESVTASGSPVRLAISTACFR